MTQQPSSARRLHPAHPAWGTRPELALVVPDPASPQLEPTTDASNPNPDLLLRQTAGDGNETADRRHLTLVSNPSTRSPR